jgi:hypothetical protein
MPLQSYFSNTLYLGCRAETINLNGKEFTSGVRWEIAQWIPWARESTAIRTIGLAVGTGPESGGVCSVS